MRCSLDPEIHPKLQRRLHKAMREIEGARSFMVDIELSRDTGDYTMYVVAWRNSPFGPSNRFK